MIGIVVMVFSFCCRGRLGLRQWKAGTTRKVDSSFDRMRQEGYYVRRSGRGRMMDKLIVMRWLEGGSEDGLIDDGTQGMKTHNKGW